MAYATVDLLEAVLGRALEDFAADAAQPALDAASAHIDRVTGQTWVAATVTGEVATVWRGRIVLRRRPVASIASLTVRAPYLGMTASALVVLSGYELVDPARGLVLLAASDGDIAVTTYTTAPVVPDDIAQATAMLAGAWLNPALGVTAQTFSKIKAGSAELIYRDPQLPVPPSVQAILDSYASGLVFA